MDSTACIILLYFLNATQDDTKYNLNPDDEDKTMFITPHGIYYYKVMTFGLKNAGVTYQKAIQKCSKS
jgi:hypothetical protein